jgi:pyruvoyl-dependent arginine decarboxylase (PvlArgDC)
MGAKSRVLLPNLINPTSVIPVKAEELRKKTLLTPKIAGGIITITSGRYYANITAQMNFSSGTLMAITLMRF